MIALVSGSRRGYVLCWRSLVFFLFEPFHLFAAVRHFLLVVGENDLKCVGGVTGRKFDRRCRYLPPDICPRPPSCLNVFTCPLSLSSEADDDDDDVG